MDDFHPYTILGEIYFLLNMLGNVHTHGGGKGEGREGGANKHGGEFRVYGNYFWAKIHGRGGCVLLFFFIVAFILCWMWMDGCVSGMHVVLKSENLSM